MSLRQNPDRKAQLELDEIEDQTIRDITAGSDDNELIYAKQAGANRSATTEPNETRRKQPPRQGNADDEQNQPGDIERFRKSA